MRYILRQVMSQQCKLLKIDLYVLGLAPLHRDFLSLQVSQAMSILRRFGLGRVVLKLS
jgi:hypothetical protein